MKNGIDCSGQFEADPLFPDAVSPGAGHFVVIEILRRPDSPYDMRRWIAFYVTREAAEQAVANVSPTDAFRPDADVRYEVDSVR